MHSLEGVQSSWWKRLKKPPLHWASALAIFAFLAGVFWIGTGEVAHAAVIDYVFQAVSWVLLQLAEFFLKISVFLLSFIIEIAGYNGYLNSTPVQVGWVMVRDITNMGFVVILLLIAFGTILGIEQYEWKKMLVKFVLAAILVNFSRIICGVFIDVSQVVMITFVNGVAATAGGNLINAFSLDKLMGVNPNVPAEGISGSGTFMASVGAITFAAIVAGLMLVFFMMLAARMVVLWVLIVLSPLAFVLSVLPQTEKYASEWWSEFGSNLITGPVLMFFIWLSFVTVGSGAIHDEISSPENNSSPTIAQGAADADRIGGQQVGISEVMTWPKMANFAIAVAMLAVGAKAAAQIGGVGASWAGNAVDFGKKVAAVAGGYTLGKWAAGGVASGASAVGRGAGWALYHGSGLASRVQRVSNWAQNQYQGFEAWRHDTGFRPKVRMKMDEKTGQMVEDRDEKNRIQYERDSHGNLVLEETKRSAMQRWFHGRVARDIQSAKILEKTTKFADNRKELLDKRTTAVPSYLLQHPDEKGDAIDRMERGMLHGEELRSGAKTKEYEALGEALVTHSRRYKDGKLEQDQIMADGTVKKAKSIEQMIVDHEMRAENTHLHSEAEKTNMKSDFLEGKDGQSLIAGQAASDVAANAFAGMRQQLLSDVKEVRSAAAKALIDAEVAKIQEKLKAEAALEEKRTGVKVDKNVLENEMAAASVEKVAAAVKVLAKDNKEIALAYTTALKKQNTILESRGQGILDDDVRQRIIGERQGIQFPAESSRAAIESMAKELGSKVEKDQMLSAMTGRMLQIAEKRRANREDPSNNPYSEKDQRIDEIYTQALASRMQKERWIDDLQGSSEKAVAEGMGISGEDAAYLNKLVENGRQVGRDSSGGGSGGVLADLKKVLGNAGEQQRSLVGALKNAAKAAGMDNLTAMAQHASRPDQMEELIRKIKTMNTGDTNGRSHEDMVALIKAMGDGHFQADQELKQLLDKHK